MSSITLLIKPTSFRCNLDCSYCFYRRVEGVYPELEHFMDLETAGTLIRKALRLGHEENLFCWQGGEPTLMGLDFFRQVVRLQRELALPGQTIGNSIQTNGVLIDKAWADFFGDSGFFVGLSLDGPEQLHDYYRKSSSGKGTFSKVMRAAQLLKDRGVQFNILTLVNDRNVSEPEKLYRFFRSHGFSHLQFIPCFETDPATGRSQPFSITGEQLGRFHCALFDLWMKDGFTDVSIRTFEDILIYYIDGVHVSCNWFQECASYLVVEHNGDVYPCDFFVFPEWKLGNIVADTFQQIAANPLRKKFARIKAELPQACKGCRWLPFCHGDCTKFRGDEKGPEAASVFCEARKMLLEHMEPFLPLIREKALLIRSKMRGGAARGNVGRNAPCPCGSGLKHKKCCGR
jgi:uncharacterized protein